MALGAVALAIGTAASVAGTVVSANAQAKMANEQKNATKRAENAREQQSQLDASRRRRQAIRESMLARATALSTATNQGAGVGTGVEGAMAQATSTGLQNQQGVNAAEVLGSRVFDANRSYADATAKGQSTLAWGSMLQGFGNALASNAPTIQKLGTYYSQRPAQAKQFETPNYAG